MKKRYSKANSSCLAVGENGKVRVLTFGVKSTLKVKGL
jgi:hypothetical protein